MNKHDIQQAALKILVVDDEESVRFTLEKILQKAGYRVVVARDSIDAHAIAAAQDLDIAIVDRMLPNGQDGLDIIRTLKNKIPACEGILISAYPSFDSARESMKYETSAYLTKPFTNQEIIQVVKQVEQKVLKSKALAEHLLMAEKLGELGALLVYTTHEINNSLQVISGCAQIMLEDNNLINDAKMRAKCIYEASESIRTLSKNIRDFMLASHADLSVMRPETPLENAREFLRTVGAIKHCKIFTEYAADIPCIKGDPVQLRQVFMNLIINAVKAMSDSDKKHLVFKTAYASETMEIDITVQDTGSGIPDAIRGKIFECFFTTWADREGTGLGLPLAKNIVENHSGRISFASKPGLWARFTVTLPAYIEAKADCPNA